MWGLGWDSPSHVSLPSSLPPLLSELTNVWVLTYPCWKSCIFSIELRLHLCPRGWLGSVWVCFCCFPFKASSTHNVGHELKTQGQELYVPLTLPGRRPWVCVCSRDLCVPLTKTTQSSSRGRDVNKSPGWLIFLILFCLMGLRLHRAGPSNLEHGASLRLPRSPLVSLIGILWFSAYKACVRSYALWLLFLPWSGAETSSGVLDTNGESNPISMLQIIGKKFNIMWTAGFLVFCGCSVSHWGMSSAPPFWEVLSCVGVEFYKILSPHMIMWCFL